MNTNILRENLVELLDGGSAHVRAEDALKNVDPGIRAARPGGEVRSAWEELEHLRIAQKDILEYTLDPNWTSPEWPSGYWPAETGEVGDETWQRSVDEFFADLARVVELVRDDSVDLTGEIPHGEGRTYLREILLVADHNAYHLGQIVQLRKLGGDWPA